MSEINELVSTIRDSKLIEMTIQYLEQISNLELIFLKNNESFKVILFDIREFLIIDNSIEQEFIGEIKGFLENSNSFWLSLDPYDERINQIQEKDNYVFNFKKFDIIKP